MGPSRAFLCILFLSGALGLTTSSTRGRLQCYACSFAKPCYPVLTECQEDEVCGVSVGTSGRTLVQWPFFGWLLTSLSCHPTSVSLCPIDQKKEDVIERKGCLPRAQCPLLGHAIYWSQSYALRHHCCEQDLCNTAPSGRLPSLPLATLLLLAWGAHIFL
uniref:Lymphocyte antigen 6 family member G6E n=1 Tax=Cricetulus griseus TaxID=10029 RepID=A0A8C2QKB9_CRIGR